MASMGCHLSCMYACFINPSQVSLHSKYLLTEFFRQNMRGSPMYGISKLNPFTLEAPVLEHIVSIQAVLCKLTHR